MRLETCHESQTQQLLQLAKLAMLPIGATEPHGNHLPLNTDTLLATTFSEQLDKELGNQCVLLPTLPYSQVWSLKGFAGAIDIGNTLLEQLVVRIAENMADYGINTLVVINTHYGNFDALKSAARQLKIKGMTLLAFSWPATQQVIQQIRESADACSGYMHADEIETSIACHLIPEQVNLAQAKANYPQFPRHFAYQQIHWSEFSTTAVLGDPTLANAEKGRLIVHASFQEVLKVIHEHIKEQHDHKERN